MSSNQDNLIYSNQEKEEETNTNTETHNQIDNLVIPNYTNEDLTTSARLSTTDIIDRDVTITSKDYNSESDNDDNPFTPLIRNPSTLPLKPFLGKLSLIAFPGMFFYLSLLLLQTINLAFIGQKYGDDNMINAIGITNLYINCTLNSIYTGLVSGIETLAANAFATRRYRLVGYYYQRARIIAYSVTTVIVIVHLFTVQHVLRFFNLNEQVIKYSSHYIYSCLIYVFFDVQTSCVFRMLNVLEKSHINFIILLISLALHPLWNYIFIYYLDFGVVGAGISFTISKFIAFVLSTIYYWFWCPCPESNFWINKKCFGIRGIINYLKFSIGAAFLTCAEWWGCEIQAIIAIYIGPDDYTVYILVAELSGLLYSIDVGFMLGITILVGEMIAKGSIKQVKLSCLYSVLFGIFSNSIYLGIFFIFRKKIFKIFTNEERILELGYPVLFVLTFSEFFDLIQTSLVSVFRGIGRQYTASALMFVHYYVIMIGMSILFGIVLKMGVFGMFIGIGSSDCLMSLAYLLTLFCIDYKKVQKETVERLKRDNSLTFGVGDEDDEHKIEDEKTKEEESKNNSNSNESAIKDVESNDKKENKKIDIKDTEDDSKEEVEDKEREDNKPIDENKEEKI